MKRKQSRTKVAVKILLLATGYALMSPLFLIAASIALVFTVCAWSFNNQTFFETLKDVYTPGPGTGW